MFAKAVRAAWVMAEASMFKENERVVISEFVSLRAMRNTGEQIMAYPDPERVAGFLGPVKEAVERGDRVLCVSVRGTDLFAWLREPYP